MENTFLKVRQHSLPVAAVALDLLLLGLFCSKAVRLLYPEPVKKSFPNIAKNCRRGGKAHYLVIDVTDVDSMPEKVRLAVNMSSTGKIDILVNSAGLVSYSDFYHMTEQEYDSIMDVNAKGTYFMSQAIGKMMIEKKIKGHILNVTSSSALRPAWTPYQMSKWAVRGLTLGLADALLPYGIIVNAIAPGPVATPMLGKFEGDSIYSDKFPSGRYAMPEEIAQLAVFMVSDMGNLIVGDTFYMTGGSGTITLHN